MKLTKREQKIAIGLGAVLLLLVVWEIALSPYFDQMDSLKKQLSDAQQQQSDMKDTFNRQKRLKKVWTEITQGGLKSSQSDAESQLQHALYDWENESGVHQSASKPERSTDVDQFTVLSFQLTETGSTWAIARLLAKFETASFPVRVNEVQILPVKEGTDDLTLHLSVSTVCQRSESGSLAEAR